MRPEWDDYFLGIAQVVAQRSHDAQTQHGCVITDANHRIIGVGYNGFPRGMDDSSHKTRGVKNLRNRVTQNTIHPISFDKIN